MNYMLWVFGGFGLLFAARWIEALGDLGATPTERLPFYFIGLAMLGSALFCFFKGWRGAIAAIKRGNGGDPEPKSSDTVIPASRIEVANASSDFDADAAFSRYMSNRDGDPTVPNPDSAPQRPTFGRKHS